MAARVSTAMLCALGLLATTGAPLWAQAPQMPGAGAEFGGLPGPIDGGAGLMAPPAMSETGRIADPKVRGSADVDRPLRSAVAGETAVTPLRSVAVPPGDMVGPPSARDRAQIDAEANRLLENLRGCRVEVARLMQISPGELTIPDLTVRWTITREGRIIDSEVVAGSPVDPQVSACVKRRLSAWRFSALTRGPARVEYTVNVP